MTDEPRLPAYQGSREIVLHDLIDVETVTNALAVYIDYMAKEYGSDEPRIMESGWLYSLDETCIHAKTVDAPEQAMQALFGEDREEWPNKVVLCMNEDCLAQKRFVDVNDAIRDTAKYAVELRQRIVKEWGYDPTHES